MYFIPKQLYYFNLIWFWFYDYEQLTVNLQPLFDGIFSKTLLQFEQLFKPVSVENVGVK